MKRFFPNWQFLKKQELLFVLGLFLVFLAIVFTNFPWGSFYTGWDNLHPEFNFGVNLKRSLFSGWQENQGLGLLGGHGFAATLPHTLFLWFLSFSLPLNYLRSTFTFLMLFTGTLGCFYLIKYLLKSEKKSVFANTAAFLGALFYMLNLATIQQFYIQLEAFIIHFAVLPWLFYTLFLLLEKNSRKNWLVFCLINLLATVQGFIPPLFVVYGLSLFIILLVYFWQNRGWPNVKKVAGILLAVVIINAYWFLPFGYYTLTKSSVYLNSFNNLQSTEDFQLKNQKYANLANLIFPKGFVWEAIDTVESGKIFYIFQPWHEHLQGKTVNILALLFFEIILFGVLFALLTKRKDYKFVSFIILLALFFTVLSTSFLGKLPLLGQAFRAGFTKFGTILSFFYSVFFALGIYVVLELIWEKSKKGWLFFACLTFAGLIYFAFPTFTGNFLYKRTKINIPDNYFALFDYFKTQNPNARIANLPQGWHWGWSIYKWGYSGSGFLWYGIQQPILDRAFDVWSNFNENYYWEISQAIYNNDYKLLEDIFSKYQIEYVVLDNNLLPYPQSKYIKYSDNLENYLDTAGFFQLVETFRASDTKVKPIKVYKVNLSNKPNNFVFLQNNLPQIEPQYFWNDYDLGYSQYGNYLTTGNLENNNLVYYPFRSLFTGRKQEELEFGVEDKNDYISFRVNIPLEMVNVQLVLPEIEENEVNQTSREDLLKSEKKYPIVSMLNNTLVVEVPKIKDYYSYDTRDNNELFSQQPKVCSELSIGDYRLENTEENGKKLLRLISKNSSNCLDFGLQFLTQKIGYVISVEARHIKGKSLTLAVINQSSQRQELEVSLPKDNNLQTYYFILAPGEEFGQGYNLHFDNISIGKKETINELGEISVYPVPYNFLTGIKLIKKDSQIANTGGGKILQVSHPNPSFYKIKVKPAENSTIILSQGYDSGWIAWQGTPILTKPLEHVLVNNWENGWELNNFTNLPFNHLTIYIFYWPQVLEYLGFGLLGGLIIWLIWKKA